MSQNRIPPAPHVRACRRSLLALLLALLVSGALAPIQGQATAHTLRTAVTVGGCPLFPANNIWNQDISHLPVHPNSANYMASIGLTHLIQGDFGSSLYAGAPIGIPYSIVPGSQPAVPMSFSYASDPGPYPYPRQAPIEGGAQSTGVRHVIVINSATCKLYETFSSYPQPDGSWKAGSGAVWNLNSNALIRAYATLANEMPEAGYTPPEIEQIKREVDYYEKVRTEVKLNSGDYIDLKVYEPAMRHLIDTYIRADQSKKLSAFDNKTLVQLLVEQGVDGLKDLLAGLTRNKSAMAETIENNLRRVIIDERPTRCTTTECPRCSIP